MRTRVIHTRIDEETLVSCVEFYNSRGGNEQDPLSTKVSVVLATFMNSLREGGELQSHNPEDVGRILDELLQKPAQLGSVCISGPRELHRPSTSPEPSFTGSQGERFQEYKDVEEAGLSSALEQTSPAENPRETLRELIDGAVDAVTQPRPELDPDVWAPDPNDLPDPGEFFFDVEKQPRTPPDDLPIESPFVIRALAFDEDQDKKREVLICQIIDHLEPLDRIDEEVFWGLHKKMVPIVDHYLEESDAKNNA